MVVVRFLLLLLAPPRGWDKEEEVGGGMTFLPSAGGPSRAPGPSGLAGTYLLREVRDGSQTII